MIWLSCSFWSHPAPHSVTILIHAGLSFLKCILFCFLFRVFALVVAYAWRVLLLSWPAHVQFWYPLLKGPFLTTLLISFPKFTWWCSHDQTGQLLMTHATKPVRNGEKQGESSSRSWAPHQSWSSFGSCQMFYVLFLQTWSLQNLNQPHHLRLCSFHTWKLFLTVPLLINKPFGCILKQWYFKVLGRSVNSW